MAARPSTTLLTTVVTGLRQQLQSQRARPAMQAALDQYAARADVQADVLATNYLAYLRHRVDFEVLFEEYHKGEKTPEQAARLVGLELPKKPDW